MSDAKSDAIPTTTQRKAGETWLRIYGHMVKDDPAFVAAAVYRTMRLALTDPQNPELLPIWSRVIP